MVKQDRAAFFNVDALMTYLAIYRKLISYHTGRYCQNLPYQCLGRYRNAFVFFGLKYWLYRSCFGHIGINTMFRQENRYQAKQKKDSKNPPNFKIHLLTLTLVFPPLLCICLCYTFLLLFLCFAGLYFYSPFIFFIYFSTCVCLSFLFWYTHLKVETKQSIKKQVTRLQSKTCGGKKE